MFACHPCMSSMFFDEVICSGLCPFYIFFQYVASLLILLTVPLTGSFHVKEIYLPIFSWIVPLMLYQKNYGYIWGHLDFFLCYIVGILYLHFIFRFVIPFVIYIPIVLASFVEKTLLPPLQRFGSFIKLLYWYRSISRFPVLFLWCICRVHFSWLL